MQVAEQSEGTELGKGTDVDSESLKAPSTPEVSEAPTRKRKRAASSSSESVRKFPAMLCDSQELYNTAIGRP